MHESSLQVGDANHDGHFAGTIKYALVNWRNAAGVDSSNERNGNVFGIVSFCRNSNKVRGDL